MARLLYQGHASMRVVADDGTVIYVDPFGGEGYDLPADIILVTHQHPDHNRIDLPKHNEGCVVLQNMDMLVDGVYQTKDIGDIHIEAVEAYNKKHDKSECVGYLVTVDDRLLYFAGDTGRTEQMETFAARHIDYAFLPIDGFYTMDVSEAIECANLIRALHTVPVHMAPGDLFSAKKAKQFVTDGAMIIEADMTINL